ncbi:MAG: hypothetical protein LUH20_05830 [Lachnospiraceae bacterium]|nr:hypothetical protein [Lachnospiraceae bacterium]
MRRIVHYVILFVKNNLIEQKAARRLLFARAGCCVPVAHVWRGLKRNAETQTVSGISRKTSLRGRAHEKR